MELTLDQALQKGVEAHRAGQVHEADGYYSAILKSQPKHPEANHNMGVLSVSAGKVQEALPFFKTALDIKPNIDQFWVSYIDALIKLNRITDAKAVLDQAKSVGIERDGYFKLEKRLDAATFRNSNTQDPPQDQLQSLINLYTENQHQEAIAQASQLLNNFPNSFKLHNIFGAINQSLKNLEQAIEAYSKALSIKPDYAEAYINIGNALKEQGKLEESVMAYQKAIAIKPDVAEAYYNMGIVFKNQGKLEESVMAYQKAIAIKPDIAEAYYNMGIVFKNQGKLEESVMAYQKAIAIKPGMLKPITTWPMLSSMRSSISQTENFKRLFFLYLVNGVILGQVIFQGRQ